MIHPAGYKNKKGKSVNFLPGGANNYGQAGSFDQTIQ